MIGGDLYAYTIIGVDYDENVKNVKYLILDPHYTGNDNDIKSIQKNWCTWRDPK